MNLSGHNDLLLLHLPGKIAKINQNFFKTAKNENNMLLKRDDFEEKLTVSWHIVKKNT